MFLDYDYYDDSYVCDRSLSFVFEKLEQQFQSVSKRLHGNKLRKCNLLILGNKINKEK